MKKKFFLLGNLIGGFLLILSCSSTAKQECELQSRVCSQKDHFGNCLRFENAFRCFVQNENEAHRCEPARNAAIADCSVKKANCSVKDASGTCLEITSGLSCESRPAGSGITAREPVLQVEYVTESEGEVPAGCQITEERCLDSSKKKLTAENAPDLQTDVSACWLNEQRFSCPTENQASSCNRLEKLGCRKRSSAVCEKEVSGVCQTWSAEYECGSPVEGDGIVIGEEEQEIVKQESECAEKFRAAESGGFACEADKELSEGKKFYRCTSGARNTCDRLENLTEEGLCADSGERSGDDRRYVCANAVSEEQVGQAKLIQREQVSDGAIVKSCSQEGDADVAKGNPATSFKKLNRQVSPQNDPSCRLTETACVGEPGIRFINGRPQFRTCWDTGETWVCRSGGADECSRFERDASCRLVSQTCPEGGSECLRPARVYRCRRPDQSAVIGKTCDDQVCIGSVCRDRDDPVSEDFASAIVQLEIARQLGMYAGSGRNRFFSGRKATCKDRKGAASCCSADSSPASSNDALGQALVFGIGTAAETIRYLGSSYVYDALSWSDSTKGALNFLYGDTGPQGFSRSFNYWGLSASYANGLWNFSFSPGGFLLSSALNFYGRYSSCSLEDQRTAVSKSQRLCHFVGFSCAKRVAGLGCVKKVEHHVCFNSRLARIINEQGRPQIGRSFGRPGAVDAEGFSTEELQRLDFSKMDLSEFTADVLEEIKKHAKGLSVEKAAQRAQERVRAMLREELPISSEVPGASASVPVVTEAK
jgi:conjugal transfer mating pair stabilization protein TraN